MCQKAETKTRKRGRSTTVSREGKRNVFDKDEKNV